MGEGIQSKSGQLQLVFPVRLLLETIQSQGAEELQRTRHLYRGELTWDAVAQIPVQITYSEREELGGGTVTWTREDVPASNGGKAGLVWQLVRSGTQPLMFRFGTGFSAQTVDYPTPYGTICFTYRTLRIRENGEAQVGSSSMEEGMRGKVQVHYALSTQAQDPDPLRMQLVLNWKCVEG